MAGRWGIAFVLMVGCYFDSPTHPVDSNTGSIEGDGSLDGQDGGSGDSGIFPPSDSAVDANDAQSDAEAGLGPDSMDAAAEAGSPDGSLACACSAALPVCLAETATCVECSAGDDAGLAACTSAKPHCTAQHRCAECLEPAHCPVSAPVCLDDSCTGCSATADCNGRPDAPVCDPASGACVECNAHTDCRDPEKPTCDQHVCRPCQSDNECAGHAEGATNLDACVRGQCVDCRVDATDTKRDYGCPDEVACDPATQRCTGASKRSRDVCAPCVADSECKAGMRCVEMFFADEGSLGGFCLLVVPPSPGCPPPYSAAPIMRSSLSGAPKASYCGVTERVSSCAAIKALEEIRLCPGGDADACGARGALCQTAVGTANRCTYACSQSGECPASTPCDGPVGAKYCGGSP